jgi:hypothetical protein
MSMSSSSNDPSFSHKNGGEVLGSKLIESMCNLTYIYIYIYITSAKKIEMDFFFLGGHLLVIKYYTVCMLMISPYI